jgi:hypothetical protein
MHDHFYTTDPIEHVNALRGRYEREGTACFVFRNPQPNTVPLYRAFKYATHDHYYTTSLADLHYNMLHSGYQNEGIACYVLDNAAPNAVPFFAMYNPSSGDNFYTTQLGEAQSASINYGYQYLGTACWVYDQLKPNTTPFFRVYETYDSFLSANLIAVAGDAWSPSQWQFFLDGFAGAAQIYRNHGLRLQSAGHFQIPAASAGGYPTIDSDSEAKQLTHDWSGPGGAADLFCVEVYAGDTGGFSATNGSCDHYAGGKKMNGSVVERTDPLNIIIAHELGHYLGFEHSTLPNNVMRASIGDTEVLLTDEQAATMKRHCYVARY